MQPSEAPHCSEVGALRYPRLRENVWYIDLAAEHALLVTSDGSFEVPVPEALAFLDVRTHCTGYLSIEEIARRSGRSLAEIGRMLRSLGDAGALFPDPAPARSAPAEAIRTLLRACAIWREELRSTTLQNALVAGELPRSTLVGWLFELHHLAHDLPSALEHAAHFAAAQLRAVLLACAQERRGDARAVGLALERLGVTRAELLGSRPFLTTRLLAFLMREVFELAPFSALLLEMVSSALTLSEASIGALRARLPGHFALPADALDPWFELQQRLAALRHGELAEQHADLFDVGDPRRLDAISDKLHEIRHAFDLLALEVRDYHDTLNGKYVPRQPVDFLSL